ncbi:MAG: formate dehydrogenase subunit gamma [Paracoccaceae bacterium]|jgi:formate dehydrogenase subunit gamma
MTMTTLRALAHAAALLLAFGGPFAAAPALAQDAAAPAQIDRSATGGAQTLDDILRRQRGETIDDSFRRDATGDPTQAAPNIGQLGTLGGASDPEIWRAIRYGTADVIASNDSPGATLLEQDAGMRWLDFRAGPLREYGAYALAGMLGLLALFYLLRGRIRIESGRSGILIERFKAVERFGHWLLAGSFVLLAITGLTQLFGRVAIIPYLGKDSFATIAIAGKWVHNNVAWAFMVALVMVFVMWVAHNVPSRVDLIWLLKGGGLFSKDAHASARKFNAGQKIIFWVVILLGASVSVSGLSLLFPFQIPLFAETFALINKTGVPAMLGFAPLPAEMAPHAEMALSQLWHSIIAFAMMAVILAHIYLGSVGMEGAYEAMGAGEVDLNWAREHHNLWVEEMEAEGRIPKSPAATPAE